MLNFLTKEQIFEMILVALAEIHVPSAPDAMPVEKVLLPSQPTAPSNRDRILQKLREQRTQTVHAHVASASEPPVEKMKQLTEIVRGFVLKNKWTLDRIKYINNAAKLKPVDKEEIEARVLKELNLPVNGRIPKDAEEIRNYEAAVAEYANYEPPSSHTAPSQNFPTPQPIAGMAEELKSKLQSRIPPK